MKETKEVKIGDYPFLVTMTKPGFCWQGESPEKSITVVAVEGSIGDWTAYFETPQSGKQVAEFGDKLPRSVAEQIFPKWAKRFNWRY
jgi:hypothetical protein